MILSTEEVEHIAELARLQLSRAEREHYREQLSEILEYAACIQALNTAGIPPTSSVFSPCSLLRDDEPRPGLSLQVLLRNAKHVRERQFCVPAVLE